MSPPGYQAPVKRASRCGNERQEGLAGGKRVEREESKNTSESKFNLGGSNNQPRLQVSNMFTESMNGVVSRPFLYFDDISATLKLKLESTRRQISK